MKLLSNIVISLVFTTTSCAYAQEIDTFDESVYLLEIPDLPNQKLLDIEGKFNDQIEKLSDKIRPLRKSIEKKKLERTKAIDAALTPKQVDTLNKARRKQTTERAKENSKFLIQFSKYLNALATAETLTVYEGLPRVEKTKLQQIKDDNKTIEINGWAFYANPLPAKGSAIEELRWSLIDFRMFEPYSG
ncbi:MAG: hypothetical protein AAGA30_17985, partial [Planctomycetota bacterium]